MIRGTTNVFKFKLPCSCSDVKSVKIIFLQDGNKGPSADRPLPITKVLGQCSLVEEKKEIVVILNQEESLRFSDTKRGKVQIRIYTHAGTCFGSKSTLFPVYPLDDDSILGDEVLPTPGYDGFVILDGESI